MLTALRTQFHAPYLRRYLAQASATIAVFRRWPAPLAAARLSENIAGERRALV
ncbi:MAG: hypothetical protein KA764_05300 [Anaerolineales bacterium]|nr:hypothetical protein [Anaerolineales bacterium]